MTEPASLLADVACSVRAGAPSPSAAESDHSPPRPQPPSSLRAPAAHQPDKVAHRSPTRQDAPLPSAAQRPRASLRQPAGFSRGGSRQTLPPPADHVARLTSSLRHPCRSHAPGPSAQRRPAAIETKSGRVRARWTAARAVVDLLRQALDELEPFHLRRRGLAPSSLAVGRPGGDGVAGHRLLIEPAPNSTSPVNRSRGGAKARARTAPAARCPLSPGRSV
jgi:hypothetical protein